MKGKGIRGIEPDGLAVVGDRSVVFAFVGIRQASVVKGNGVRRIEPCRLAVVRDRSVVITFVPVR